MTLHEIRKGLEEMAQRAGLEQDGVSKATARGSGNIGSLEAPRRRLLPALYH